MTENKQEILNKLLPALQATRDLNDVSRLQYNDATGTVRAYFYSRTNCGPRMRVKNINVYADSGLAMIKDIVWHIV